MRAYTRARTFEREFLKSFYIYKNIYYTCSRSARAVFISQKKAIFQKLCNFYGVIMQLLRGHYATSTGSKLLLCNFYGVKIALMQLLRGQNCSYATSTGSKLLIGNLNVVKMTIRNFYGVIMQLLRGQNIL
jgi:hypothetical protein